MSDKNETEKSNVSKKSSLFEKLKSKYIQKWTYNFIPKYESPKIAHELLKYNQRLSPLQLEINNKNRIDQLSDFRNWYYYLKYIYSALSEVAKKIYDNAYQKLKDPDRNKLDKYKKHAIEAVIYMCLFDIVYLTENKKIFNTNDLKIQKAKSDARKDLDKVSLKATIFNIIQKAINQSLNSTTSNLKNSIEKLFKEVLQLDDCWNDYYGIVADYLSKKFPNYKKNDEFKKTDDEFKKDLCCLITKILWLKNNNFYEKSMLTYSAGEYPEYSDVDSAESEDFNLTILDELFLPNPCPQLLDMINDTFIEYVFDYQTFIKSLRRNDDLYLIVCNNRDFDVRGYFSAKFGSAIKSALTTKEQKCKFEQFLKSKEELKKGEPIPKSEKEDFKNI